MDLRPLGFEWRPRGPLARALALALSAFVGVCLAVALGTLVGVAARRALLDVSAAEVARGPLWAVVGMTLVILAACGLAFREEVRRALGRMRWGARQRLGR